MTKAINTRLTILQKAFELIYINGYQATSIDDIIATTKVTKGAFYYHFKTKDEMGLAVINDLMYGSMADTFVKPLSNSNDPITDIYALMHYLLMKDPFLQVKYGCPAGNLTQEMSPLNTEFNSALTNLTKEWQDAIQKSISNGKKAGNVNIKVNASHVAYFVMSGYWGIRNFGKLQNSKDCYKLYLKELKNYLKILK
jgi:TetR/AcrR family transcriptional repressor of nem operon